MNFISIHVISRCNLTKCCCAKSPHHKRYVTTNLRLKTTNLFRLQQSGWSASYRPQRSWAKVTFLQASVILSTGGGGLPQCMMGCHPPPPRSRHPIRADTPSGADPPPAYGQRVAGTYPSEMHCFHFLVLINISWTIFVFHAQLSVLVSSLFVVRTSLTRRKRRSVCMWYVCLFGLICETDDPCFLSVVHYKSTFHLWPSLLKGDLSYVVKFADISNVHILLETIDGFTLGRSTVYGHNKYYLITLSR